MVEVQSLVLLKKGVKMLAECRTIQDFKQVADMAAAAKVYAKKHKLGMEAILYANSINFRALKGLGEMLRATGRAKGKLKRGPAVPQGNHGEPPTLAELDITKKESSQAQRIAEVAADPAVFKVLDEGKRTVAQIRQEQRKEKTKAAEEEAAKAVKPGDRWRLTDAQDVVECVALVTDPPYGIIDEPWEPNRIEAFTRDWLSRWMECRADFIFSFWSQRFLWDGRRWFDESLGPHYEFQQVLVWHYANNKSPQSRKGFKQTWEPIFFYRRRDSERQIRPATPEWGEGLHDFDCHVAAVPQSNFVGAEMKQHPAQKPVSVMRWLVNACTSPGDLVADPFAGSGTTGVAAVQLGRRFHGIETDRAFLELARGRIAAYGQSV